MPPKKRKVPEEPPSTPPNKRVTRSATLEAMRLTRSGSKYGSVSISESGSAPSGPGSSPLGAEKKKKKEDKKAKQSKNEVEEVKLVKKEEEEVKGGGSSSKPGKTIVIERCTQCQSFRVTATKVKDGLEEKVPGITVKMNPEKPRKGCFEIREEGGEKFISLLNMKRPFKLMKDLDMDKVISDIVDKINGIDTANEQDTADDQDDNN